MGKDLYCKCARTPSVLFVFLRFGDVSDFSEQICTAMRKPGPKHDKRLDLPRIRFGAHLGMDLWDETKCARRWPRKNDSSCMGKDMLLQDVKVWSEA